MKLGLQSNEWPIFSWLQTLARTGFFAVKATTHPAIHSPCSRHALYLPPRDLKGENMPSLRRDRDRWCWVQGVVAVRRIRCPPLLLACPRVSFNFRRSTSCTHAPFWAPLPVAWLFYPMHHKMMVVHDSWSVWWQTNNQVCTLVNKHQHLCGAKFILVSMCCKKKIVLKQSAD